MSLPAILAQLRDVGGAVVGVNAAYPELPETPPAGDKLPAWVVTSRSGDVTYGQVQVRTHAVTGHLLYHRAGDFRTEKEAVNAFLELFIAAFNDAITLGGLVYGFSFDSPAYAMDEPVTIKNESYHSLTFSLSMKEKVNATPSG